MKFTINSTRLTKAIAKVMPAISQNVPMPILGDFLITATAGGNITISGTDTNLYITTTVLSDTTEQDGATTIQALTLNNLLKSLPDQSLTFESGDGCVKIKSSNGQYSIAAASSNEYPTDSTTHGEITSCGSIKQANFKDLVNVTTFASSNDMLRAHMGGVLLNFHGQYLTAAATDATVLSEYSIPMDKYSTDMNTELNCTKESLIAASKLGGDFMDIGFTENKVIFWSESTTISALLISDRFPDYKPVIPTQSSKTATVDRNELLASIKRVSQVANLSSNTIVVSLNSENITISGEDDLHGRSGSETINHSSYTGEDIRILFDYKNALSILSKVQTQEVYLQLNESNKPLLVKPLGDVEYSLILLLMPQL